MLRTRAGVNAHLARRDTRSGHYSLLVEVRQLGRPLCTASTLDAAYTRKNYDNDINAGFHIDPVAGVNSMRRLKQIEKEKNAEVLFSHDPESFKDYKTGVNFYG